MIEFVENFFWVFGATIAVDLIYPRIRGFDPKPLGEMMLDATVVGLIIAVIFWFKNRRSNDETV